MIYFDTAYIAKCYLNEAGSEPVRQFATAASGLCSCEWARLEFACVLHRHVREGRLDHGKALQIRKFFSKDQEDGVWTWLPVTSELLDYGIEKVRTLRKSVLIRAGDAIHLACAQMDGFKDIYSNDARLLQGAAYFGLRGQDLLA